MREKTFAVYIMANARPTLYIGMPSDLRRRVYEHKIHHNPLSFTARYRLDRLVYYEVCDSSWEAIIREKQIKDLSRSEKIALIRGSNPTFKDLYEEIGGSMPDYSEPSR